jgi:nucleotide-binding universal stress UspA family protein
MAYKSILTILTNDVTAPLALGAGVEIARREKGHLDVLCLGIDRTQVGYYYAGANAIILQETLKKAEKEADAMGALAKSALGKEDVPWGADTAVAQIGGVAGLVADRARFADLVVLPKPYGKGRGMEDEAVIEAAMFEGHAPVLVVPDQGFGKNFGRRILVAWNESPEAMAAIRAALPLLVKADLADIAIVDPPRHGPDRSDPGGRLSQMLARHGAKAEVSVLAKTLPRASDVIRRHATDRAADMVVMGAYGHSRFREAILGGATRNMLEQAEIPIFMAH